jgi:hypothetical protein
VLAFADADVYVQWSVAVHKVAAHSDTVVHISPYRQYEASRFDQHMARCAGQVEYD